MNKRYIKLLLGHNNKIIEISCINMYQYIISINELNLYSN